MFVFFDLLRILEFETQDLRFLNFGLPILLSQQVVVFFEYFSHLFPTPGTWKIQAEKKEGLTAVLPMDAPDEDAKDGIADGNESSSTESSGRGVGELTTDQFGYIWIYVNSKKNGDFFLYQKNLTKKKMRFEINHKICNYFAGILVATPEPFNLLDTLHPKKHRRRWS